MVYLSVIFDQFIYVYIELFADVDISALGGASDACAWPLDVRRYVGLLAVDSTIARLSPPSAAGHHPIQHTSVHCVYLQQC